MIVIFEGADGVGKSTAIHILREVLERDHSAEVRVLHRGVPTRDPLLEYTVDLEHAGTDTDVWTLCDRWHWGELIYGPLYRGRSLLTGAGHQAVDEYLHRRCAMLIHLDGTTSEIIERVRVRGDDYIEQAHLPFIIDEYRRIREMRSLLHRRTMYDFTHVSAREVITEVHTLIHTQRGRNAH